MAILQNFDHRRTHELKDFDGLALGTHNATRDIIDAHLDNVNPEEALVFQKAYEAYVEACRRKMDHVLRTGTSDHAVELELDVAYKAYAALREKHRGDPVLAFLDSPIHRKSFDARPYEIKGKHMPPNPYLGATAAMDGIWPGYDKPEYLTQFPFLHAYEAVAPGKAMQAFLRAHNMFFHFPETVSRYGVLFVPPPYLEDDLNVELRRHLSTCDKLFHTAPTLTAGTTTAEAHLILSYTENDMVAVVTDEAGSCIGVVEWNDLKGKEDGALVGTFCKKDWNEAPKKELSPRQAFEYMEKREWSYMLRFSEHGPRIVTLTTASVSHFLPPHTFKEGLGSAVYFGISDVREGDRLIDRLTSEADGIPAVFVETAHADTEYYRTILKHYRDKLSDVFLMAGTTVDPEAVLDFLVDCGADGVKLGIAEGTACRTSKSGVALPNAHVGLECGAAAFGKGYMLLDGWGHSDEFIKGIAMSGIQMRQGGGSFMGRREAASPSLKVNGVHGKYYRGMAGADVQQEVLGHKASDPIKRMEASAHLHSEGAEVFVPHRSPSTVGRMLLSHMFLLKSAMSYAGVRSELDDPKNTDLRMRERALYQFHRMAKLYAVPAS